MARGDLVEAIRVLFAIGVVERGRLTRGPGPLVLELRSVGRRERHRSPEQRRRLQQVIDRIDAHMPGGGNCYRRALLEIALDPDAAAEPLSMGLDASGAPMSGHAWLGADARDRGPRSYDAVITV